MTTESSSQQDVLVGSESTTASSGHRIEIPWAYGSKLALILIMVVVIASGLCFIFMQKVVPNYTSNSLFVGTLIAATWHLMSGMQRLRKYFQQNTFPFFEIAIKGESINDLHARATVFGQDIYDTPKMTLCGFAYGIVIVVLASFFVSDVLWKDSSFQYLLALFLFAVNFVTGVGFYGLVRFFILLSRIQRELNISIWHRRSKSTEFIDTLRNKIAWLAAFYVTLSITSIVFSEFPMKDMVLVYSIFCCSVIIVAYALPGVFIRNQIEMARMTTMELLDDHLNREFNSTLNSLNDPGAKVSFDNLEGLLKLRNDIELIGMRAVSWRSFRTTIGIISLSALPPVLQYVLEKYGTPF
jgi:hypothetical protein